MKAITHIALITASGLALITGYPAKAQDVSIHVSQAEAIKAAKQRIEPEYPAVARQLHLEGAVELEAHIGENGSVEEVKPLTGNAILMNAAVTAIKKWKFSPFLADGKPSKAVADLSFRFKL
jgi:protein TonB